MEAIDTEILKMIAGNTDSVFILFAIILAAAGMPVTLLILKHNKNRHAAEDARREQDSKRENNLIQVITANTAIMEGLKTALESNNAALLKTVERIHTRIDNQAETLQLIFAAISKQTKSTAKGRTT